jgi:hypothetical protein
MFMEEYSGLMVEFSAGMRSSISSMMGSVVAGLELVMAVAETEECFPPQASHLLLPLAGSSTYYWNRLRIDCQQLFMRLHSEWVVFAVAD